MREPLDPAFLPRLREALAPERVLTESAERWPYGQDNSRRHALPDAVALPVSHDEVAAAVALCHEYGVPLTCRGTGTGTTGAAVPFAGGLVLSLERMNRILRIDPANRLLVAEAGATNQSIQKAAGEQGFFWPPDPSSAAICTIGGNLACNAAGPRAVKYGTTRDNTRALRAVTGTGQSLRVGELTSKGVVGYDLTRLLIGSEGTLAVITEATLALTPLPEGRRTMQVTYADIGGAARAVAAIMAQPVTPCTLEFIDGAAIDMIRDYSSAKLPENAGAMLMIEVDGQEAALDDAAAAVAEACRNDALLELTRADTAEATAALWATRKALSPALRNIAPKKINEDIVVPVSRMPELIEGLDALSEKYAIRIVNFGHAGNGNIHVNMLIDPDDPVQMKSAEACLDEIFGMTLELGGTLSGEHGIGVEKRDHIARELDPVALTMMRAIRAQFDPKGILNPGKALPLQPGEFDPVASSSR